MSDDDLARLRVPVLCLLAAGLFVLSTFHRQRADRYVGELRECRVETAGVLRTAVECERSRVEAAVELAEARQARAEVRLEQLRRQRALAEFVRDGGVDGCWTTW